METNKTINSNEIKYLNGENIRLINSFSDQSTEIDEIISRRPPFFVRWGIVFFFVFLLMLCGICWFVQYPDVIISRGVLSSINAPKEIQAKINGKLVRLLVSENSMVKTGDVLGYIESTSDHSEVISLSKELDTISAILNKGNINEISSHLNSSFKQLGELQSNYQTFSNAFFLFANYLEKGYYIQKRKMLLDDIEYLKRLHTELVSQKELLVKDLSLADSTFRIYQTLKKEKVISTIDYRLENSKFISKQLTLPQVNSSLVANESQQHDKMKEIAELDNQIRQQKNIFEQALNTIKSQVDDWKTKYLLISPVEGRVSFTGFIQEKQELKTGQLICFINPGNTDYYVETLIPQYNFGKIKASQLVMIKFQAYPYQEFGIVKGRIEQIKEIPTDSGYLAKVSMPEGLITNYSKKIQYRNGLLVQAEVITENTNILQRLFYNLRKMVN